MGYSLYPLNPLSCNLPVTVFGIGFEDNQPHVQRKEGFPIPQLFICKSGEGTLRVKGNDFLIKRGSFFLLMPNIPHEYYGNTDRWEVRWLAFSGNQADSILTELKLDSTITGILADLSKIEIFFKKIYTALQADDSSGRIIASGLLYEMLVELFTIRYAKQAEGSEGNRIIQQLMLYIDEHYNQDITLEELSAYVSITPQYLCKLFQKHLNLRPFQYITMKRIQCAKKMLSDNTLSVQEIAHMTGYKDCSYFCAVFKKYEMLSPTQFRGL